MVRRSELKSEACVTRNATGEERKDGVSSERGIIDSEAFAYDDVRGIPYK